MFTDDIRPFLESQGWHRLAVMPSKHGENPGSVFHQFSNQSLQLLIEDVAGNNGIVAWMPVDAGLGAPQIAARRDFMRAFDPRPRPNPSVG